MKRYFSSLCFLLCLGLYPAVGAYGYDVNADATSDILWRNKSSGLTYAYLMQNSAVMNGGAIATVSDPAWKVIAAADFNGDNRSDLLWRNTTSGQNFLYLMNGLSYTPKALNTVPDVWNIAAVGDFNCDGQADIWWRHSANYANYIHFVVNGSVQQVVKVPQTAGAEWHVAGSGDVDGNGCDDIIWRNSTSGANYVYLLNNGAVSQVTLLNLVPDQNWQIVAVNDFNNDGQSDLMWRNFSTGDNYIYFLNNAAISSVKYINTVGSQDWQVAASGDYNGDGFVDLLWRNQATGANALYLLNNGAVASIKLLGSAAPEWCVVPSLLSTLLQPLAPSDPTTEIIAAIGMHPPGYPQDYIYWDVSDPSIGSSGHIAFPGVADISLGSTANSSNAVWSGLPGQLEVVIKENDAIGGLPANILFDFATTTIVNSMGDVAFLARLKGAVNNSGNQAVLTYTNGGVEAVMRVGQPAPGFPAGTLVNQIKHFAFSDSGLVFQVVTSTSSQAIYHWDSDTLVLIAVGELGSAHDLSQESPDGYPGCSYSQLYTPVINQQGSLFFGAAIFPAENGNGAVCPGSALLQWQDGQLTTVVDNLQAIPGTAQSLFMLNSTSYMFMQSTDTGYVNFFTRAQGSTSLSSWFTAAGDTPQLVVLSGEHAPGQPNSIFGAPSSLYPAAVSNSSRQSAAYALTLDGKQVILQGMPRSSQPYPDLSLAGESQLNLVAETGMQPPGMPATSFFSQVGAPSITEDGHVIFWAITGDALSNATSYGLWQADAQGKLQKLVAIGDGLDFAGGTTTLTHFWWMTGDNELGRNTTSGRTMQISNQRQVVVKGRTNDVYSAILLIEY